MGQPTITSPWRVDTRSEGDSHSRGSASGGKLKRVTTCFRQVTRQVGKGLSLPPQCPAHLCQATSGPGRPKVTCPPGGAPTQPQHSPEQQVGTQEGEQAAQRPLPAQELVGAAAQPQHGLPEEPGQGGGHLARGLLHLRPRARPPCLRCSLLPGNPGPRRLFLRSRGWASLRGVLPGRQARHLQRRFAGGDGDGDGDGVGREGRGRARARLAVSARKAAATGRGSGCAPRGSGGWVPYDVSPGHAGEEGAVKFAEGRGRPGPGCTSCAPSARWMRAGRRP